MSGPLVRSRRRPAAGMSYAGFLRGIAPPLANYAARRIAMALRNRGRQLVLRRAAQWWRGRGRRQRIVKRAKYLKRRNYKRMVCVSKKGGAFRTQKQHKRFEHKVRCVLQSTPKEKIVGFDNPVTMITADPGGGAVRTGASGGGYIQGFTNGKIFNAISIAEGSDQDTREGREIQVKRVEIRRDVHLQCGYSRSTDFGTTGLATGVGAATAAPVEGQHVWWHTVVLQFKPKSDMTLPDDFSKFFLSMFYKKENPTLTWDNFQKLLPQVVRTLWNQTDANYQSEYKLVFKRRKKIRFPVRRTGGAYWNATTATAVYAQHVGYEHWERRFTDRISFTPAYHITYSDATGTSLHSGECILLEWLVPCGYGSVTNPVTNDHLKLVQEKSRMKINWVDLNV